MLKIKSFFSVLVLLFLVGLSSVVFSQPQENTSNQLKNFNESQTDINNLLNQLDNLSTDLEEASEQLSIILPQLKDSLTKAQTSLIESESLVEDLKTQLKDLETRFNSYQKLAEGTIQSQAVQIDGLKFTNKILAWTSGSGLTIAAAGWGMYLFEKGKNNGTTIPVTNLKAVMGIRLKIPFISFEIRF